MISSIKATLAILAVTSTVAAMAGQAKASTFAAWEVANVPFGDVLNVRKYPSSSSQKQGAYPNGTVLSMTGKCTGGVDLFEIASLPVHVQVETVRFKWCQVWHDPSQSGQFVLGWVYGRYITPH